MTQEDQLGNEDAKYVNESGANKATTGGNHMLFTYDDFRAEEGLRAELASFLNSEVGQIAMRVMRMKYRPCDVPSNADSLASVRVLSQLHGTSVALDDLELLATAPTPNVNIEATYEATETDHVNIDEILKPQIIISKETQT